MLNFTKLSRTDLMGILVFLAHAPGLFMRGGPEVEGWSTDPCR